MTHRKEIEWIWELVIVGARGTAAAYGRSAATEVWSTWDLLISRFDIHININIKNKSDKSSENRRK